METLRRPASQAPQLRTAQVGRRDTSLSPGLLAFLLVAAIAAGTLTHLRPGPPETVPPPPPRVESGPVPKEPDPPPSSKPLPWMSEPFAWPALPESAEPVLPRAMEWTDAAEFRAAQVSALYRDCDAHPFLDIGNAILKIPELILDGTVELLGGGMARIEKGAWASSDQPSMTSLLLRLEFGPYPEPLYTQLVGHWADQERTYLRNFVDSRAFTAGFEERTEDVDLRELEIDQRKVLMDALRRTYLSRYKVQAHEHLREDAWYVNRWSGADLVVMPPLMAGYLFYRGLDKKFSLGPSTLRVSLEPLSEWVERSRNFPVAAGLDWKLKGLPVGLIVSVGIRGGRYELDFAGIGTSLAPARQALLRLEGREDR